MSEVNILACVMTETVKTVESSEPLLFADWLFSYALRNAGTDFEL